MKLEQAVAFMEEVNQNIPIIGKNQRRLMELFALTDYQSMNILLDKNITLIQETLKKNNDSLRIYNERYPEYASQLLTKEEKDKSDSEAKKHQISSEKISAELNHALDIDLNLKKNIERYSGENPSKYKTN